MESPKTLIQTSISKRIFISLMYLLLVRIGTVLRIPGIDNSSLSKFIATEKTFFTFLNSITGGNISTIGLFALNIFPAINASILLEFLIPLIPKFEKWRKEEGELGEKKLSRVKKLLIIIVAALQCIGIISFLRPFIFDWSFSYLFSLGLSLVTGALIVFWISELITEKGIANGSSLLIFSNILGSNQKLGVLSFIFKSDSKLQILLLLLFFVILIGLIILLQECTREISIISAQQLTGEALPYLSKRNASIPLKLNQAGILPIIFASAIYFLPYSSGITNLSPFVIKYIFPCFYYLLIITFTYLYSIFAWDPKKIAEDLKKTSSSIPGIRPGIQTEKYLKNILVRVSLIGGLMLALIMSFPSILQVITKDNYPPLNVTSLIILIGVSLDIQKNIKTLLLTNLISTKKGVSNESSSIS